jgi:hypothetical protein
MGHKSRFPLAHRLPSERATTFTDHSDLSTPVDASDGHRPAARASPSAASAMCTKRRCRYQFLFHQPTLPQATGNGGKGAGEEARTGEKVHGHAQFCVGLAEHTTEHTTGAIGWEKRRQAGGGKGGARGPVRPALRGNSAGASSSCFPACTSILVSEAQRLAASAHAGR